MNSLNRSLDSQFPIDRPNQRAAPLSRQHAALHAVHHIGKTDFILRIRERHAAPRARMTKGSSLRTKRLPQLASIPIERIQRKPAGKSHSTPKHLVKPVHHSLRDPTHRLTPEKTPTIPLPARRQHRMKFCKRRRRSDPAHRGQACLPHLRVVHGRNRAESLGTRKRTTRKRVRIRKRPQKLFVLLATRGCLRSNHIGDARLFLIRNSNPKIQTHRPRKNPPPVVPERLPARQPPDHLVQKKSKHPRAVCRSLAHWNQRPLGFDRPHHRTAVHHFRHRLVQGAKPRAVRHHLPDRHAAFATTGKFRPHIRHAQIRPRPPLLQGVQQAGRSRRLGGGPHQHRRIALPLTPARRIRKSPEKIRHLDPAVVNANRRPRLQPRRKIRRERLPQRPHSLSRITVKSGSSLAISRNLSSITKLVFT